MAISSRKQRAPIGLQELAFLVAGSTRERAFDVSEQFAFQQVLWQSTAGDFDERLVATITLFVNRSSRHGLAGTALTENQHRRARWSDTLHDVEHLQHLVVVANDVAHAVAFGELSFQVAVLFQHPPLLNRAFD